MRILNVKMQINWLQKHITHNAFQPPLSRCLMLRIRIQKRCLVCWAVFL